MKTSNFFSWVGPEHVFTSTVTNNTGEKEKA